MSSVEVDLIREKIMHLDLQEFLTVEQGTPVQQVVAMMRRQRSNCALVLDGSTLTGIFTDRDVLKKVVASPDTWAQPIETVMTPAPATVAPQDSAEKALAMMKEGQFRNVPVLDEQGAIRGNVSHYAFIKFLADHFPQEIYNLPPDDGITEDRYGG